jgi:hypothetical protein
MATQLQNHKRWKVTNVTVRPQRMDQKTGVDARTAIEKNGYSVSWREENTNNRANIVLGPGQAKIVSELTDGLINLFQGGLVQVEEFADIADILKAHTAQGTRTHRRGTKAPAATSDAVAAPKDPQSRRQANAAAMGADVMNKEARAEHVDAINPTGTPNFVVNAPSDETRRKQKQQQEPLV